ncbi:tripartite tricarboxylate transporter TctB family protein [Pseudomonas sp. GD03944]|uniref:tripartite tricarboxylate transporter TctB family protein n=1 Tax=Pseudomonas sp. GD03944 TaxID=2975409 RepID=UPI002448A34F|nr:tripartite tricarboxylate transporter TctB family protein [Pseudomonas sp. GD03944]MDH1263432.1 tripartite tricarboxylate transporter TctB family protein [Pseudomonas sp. GD03944]
MKDLLFGLIFIVTGIAVLVLARDFPSVPGMQYGADLFPSLIAIGMILGGIILSLSAVKQLRQSTHTFQLPPRFLRSTLGAALPCVMVAAYILFNETLGSALMMLLIMLALLVQQGVRVLPAGAISVAATAVISLSFGHLLKVPLPTGPLGF